MHLSSYCIYESAHCIVPLKQDIVCENLSGNIEFAEKKKAHRVGNWRIRLNCLVIDKAN